MKFLLLASLWALLHGFSTLAQDEDILPRPEATPYPYPWSAPQYSPEVLQQQQILEQRLALQQATEQEELNRIHLQEQKELFFRQEQEQQELLRRHLLQQQAIALPPLPPRSSEIYQPPQPVIFEP